MQTKQKQQYRFKYLIVGDSGVGKTSLIMRYVQNDFQEEYLSTVGIDFKVKKIETDDFRAVLNIWDTAGQQRFRTITKNFYKGSDGIILAYSINDLGSYAHIDSWVSQIKTNCSENVHIVLIGCKSDLQSQRKITKEQGLKMASKYKCQFFQVSAKTNKGIQQTFLSLTKQVFEQRQEKNINKTMETTSDNLNKLKKQQPKQSSRWSWC